ncbi:hypothetical protein C8Q77DRAFT_509204 [Trametes polyzona]|nr:hypothetical protein C8Q77DRAFT_509204 [Trametes polyzona]
MVECTLDILLWQFVGPAGGARPARHRVRFSTVLGVLHVARRVPPAVSIVAVDAPRYVVSRPTDQYAQPHGVVCMQRCWACAKADQRWARSQLCQRRQDHFITNLLGCPNSELWRLLRDLASRESFRRAALIPNTGATAFPMYVPCAPCLDRRKDKSYGLLLVLADMSMTDDFIKHCRASGIHSAWRSVPLGHPPTVARH